MQSLLKIALVAVTAGLIGVAAAPSSMAQTARAIPRAMPYNSYQGPNGGYDSLSAYIRSVNGTPCGMNCTREAQERTAQPMPNWIPAW